MPQALDPTRPGQFGPIPADRDALLIEALRFANRISGLLHDLDSAVGEITGDSGDPAFDRVNDLLLRRFTDCSGLGLFVAASNLKLDLPDDLLDYAECEACGEELKEGDRVYGTVDGGPIHERCAGETENFVGEDGNYLPAGAARPEPAVYSKR